MDNLVSIYKSMEVASGLTIFTTQVAPPKNNEALQVADDRKSNASKRILMPKDSTSGKRSSKGKRKKMEKLDSRTSDPCSTRPSCSSNKRIHVTPYPVSETPVQQKRSNKLAISTTEAMDRTEIENDSTLGYKRLEDHTLQPFFWLREANEEDESVERMTTQETTGLITPKKNVPCFSDIKDSEDINTPQKATPISKSPVQEAFDSEMFEWTQMACSPELFSTPTKKQTAGGESFNGFNDDNCRAISLHLLESPKHCHQQENAKTTSISCTRIGTLKKRHRQTKSKKFIGETAIISLNEELPFGSNEILEDSSRGKKSSKKARPLRSTRKVHARSRKPTNLYPKSCTTSILNGINELVDAQGEVPANSSKAIHDIESTSKTLAESSHSKSMDIVVAVQNKCQKRTKKATPKTPSESKRPSSDLAELEAPDTNLLGNPRKDKSPNHELDKTNSRCQLSSFKQNGCQGSRRTMFGLDKKFKVDAREQGDQEMPNMQNVDMLAAKPYHKVQQDNRPFLNLHKSYVSSKAKEVLHLPTNEIFKKCKNVPSPVKCAFCHSSSDSEVSGEIMHYFNGKPVASDYNEGVNVIHSHRSCTEWAPDVFFNDDLVINLSTELARSRRITCSCCGIKGAALGCFEKSCRRSFHYPCAKQTPECRWDYEHFVMLCPLHSSSKFPSETSELQKPKRKTSGSKIIYREVPPTSQPIDVAERNCKWAWPSRFPCKWILCSSALSGTQKETLSKFASLTGVSVLKTWSSAVTHVIASTDENGACKRTLKFMMGILEGKWILSIEWIKACMEFMKPVDEEKYEISVDVYGIHSGPHLGRMRIANKEPKIFTSFWFYFSGDFVSSYKGYLHDLIIAAGGKVLQRRPISMALKKLPDDSSDTTFIVYSLEFSENKRSQDEKVLDNRKVESIALAEDCGAKVVTNSWILDSIAASALQTLPY
ncbi:hypothetical protein KSP39_PZI009112 [Platanthera zijinensis]|uniref:Uncharacterized protein n=1 Tax=Platanthera zijinensis TaxID=2320716 RepID=A0AAP0G7U2_9ASPA